MQIKHLAFEVFMRYLAVSSLDWITLVIGITLSQITPRDSLFLNMQFQAK